MKCLHNKDNKEIVDFLDEQILRTTELLNKHDTPQFVQIQKALLGNIKALNKAKDFVLQSALVVNMETVQKIVLQEIESQNRKDD